MSTTFHSLSLLSNGFGNVIDLTDNILLYTNNSNINNGILFLYNSSLNVVFIKGEINNIKSKLHDDSFKKVLQYSNNNNTLIIPIINKKLYLNEMERIIFIDFKTASTKREIIIGIQT